MELTTAVLVDDSAEQRAMLSRVLSRAGWAIHTAADSTEGEALAARLLAGPDAAQTVILTDMHMPGDPYAAAHPWAAGAYFALGMRARMQWGELPRAPIVGLSSLLAPEMLQTALAFGCDAVLDKNPPIDLGRRVAAALEQADLAGRLAGLDAMLRLARSRLAQAPARAEAPGPALTVADVNAALLAYRRYGLVGLGQSALARALAPRIASAAERGACVHARLIEALDRAARLRLGAPAELLRAELSREASPGERAPDLALSRAQYYRYRQRAVHVLRDLLAHAEQHTMV